MENTAVLMPEKPVIPLHDLSSDSHSEPPSGSERYSVPIPGMSLGESPSPEETEELPRADSALRRESARRRRFPLFQLLAALAGGAAGVYFTLTLPEGADLSGSLLCRPGEFYECLLRRLAWGGGFLLGEYLAGFFALGWLVVWILPVICGLGTGAALAAAFSAGTNAALLIFPAVGAAVTIALAAGTARNMSAQLLQLLTTPCGVVSQSPAAGEYSLRFLIWCVIFAAFALVECALRCFVS